MYHIAAFYHLTPLENPSSLQKPWKNFMEQQHVTGTILVTPEGVNGTIAGPTEGIQATLAMLKSHPNLGGLQHKSSWSESQPFGRTKVKLKKETIPLGVTVDVSNPGTYLNAQEWNELLQKPETFIVDTRNDYEVHIGYFKGAKDPRTRTFKQLPQWLEENLPEDKSAPIAMYCTGGIRCEKSTAYVKQQGYTNVYHLHGGILQYLEDMPEEQSLWVGDCYVFDDRVAVNHQLQPSVQYNICKVCNTPITAGDLRRAASPETNPCPHCHPRS